jgi:tRNA 2-(methylsulfanyl)-N6-isopentenyladenosine37 hydroxylase
MIAVMDIHDILQVKTPKAWLDYACMHLDTVLIDHAHCEKKAAQTAIHLILRYPEFHNLVHRVSRFAREELRHFEQVYALMRKRGIALKAIAPSGYAKGLISKSANHEPQRMIDSLIIAAIIEARSCERFEALAPLLDDELSKFYNGLLHAEKRHFLAYLELACEAANGDDIGARIQYFSEHEATLIMQKDACFRFHSGIPC